MCYRSRVVIRWRAIEASQDRGGRMSVGFYVLAAFGLVVVVGILMMIPDIVRYMKMRAM
jgi:hypothetical protein